MDFSQWPHSFSMLFNYSRYKLRTCELKCDYIFVAYLSTILYQVIFMYSGLIVKEEIFSYPFPFALYLYWCKIISFQSRFGILYYWLFSKDGLCKDVIDFMPTNVIVCEGSDTLKGAIICSPMSYRKINLIYFQKTHIFHWDGGGSIYLSFIFFRNHCFCFPFLSSASWLHLKWSHLEAFYRHSGCFRLKSKHEKFIVYFDSIRVKSF